MIFLSGVDDVNGVAIPTPPQATIHPPAVGRMGPPASTTIPQMVSTPMAAGPSGKIAKGTGADEPATGLPLSRTVQPINIGAPTASLPAFPVPGAGEEARSLAPPPIKPGASGAVRSLTDARRPNVQEQVLGMLRTRVQPLLDYLASLPANERGSVLREAFSALDLPDAEPAIERLSLKFMAAGAQPAVAFREALVRVLATNITIIMPQQYNAAKARAAARGDANSEYLAGLGFLDSVVKGIKSIGKKAIKAVAKIADVGQAVACNGVVQAGMDAVQGGAGASACGAASVAKVASKSVNSVANPKAKAKAKAPAPAPMPAPMPRTSVSLPSPRVSAPLAKSSGPKVSKSGKLVGGPRVAPSAEKKVEKKSNAWVWLLVLAAGGGGAYYWYMKKHKGTKPAEKKPLEKKHDDQKLIEKKSETQAG